MRRDERRDRRVREWRTLVVGSLRVAGTCTDAREAVGTALDAGANEYLTKPFGVGELLARMRVALRHAARAAGQPEEPVLTIGELRVDLERRRVLVAEREVHLTPIEYKLLLALVRHVGKVLTHRHLLKEVWGTHAVTQTPTLRVHMTQLRHTLERDPAQPHYLLMETGVGYRLRAE